MKDIKDKVVVITGASSGIGYALADNYARLGAKVSMAARNPENLKKAHGEITSKGGDAIAVVCDVSKEEDCKHLMEETVKKYGGIDILICNAGISMRALFDNIDMSVLHSLMDINFWGCANCCRYALKYIQERKGSIVGVSSVAGLHGLPARTGYSASKYAMTGLLDTLRVENLKKGVHVMIACPGFTASNIRYNALLGDGSKQGETPRKEEKMMTADQAAMRIIKGVSKRKREVLMDFNGRGTKFFKKISPAFVDRMFYNAMAKEDNSPLK